MQCSHQACLVAGLLALSIADSVSAQQPAPPAATQTWVCTDKAITVRDARAPLELVLKDGLLITQPHGTPRYGLLVNNAHALIGVDHFGDFDPVVSMVTIFAATIVIDKATGSFSIALTASDAVSMHRAGHCRMFEQRAPADQSVAYRP